MKPGFLVIAILLLALGAPILAQNQTRTEPIIRVIIDSDSKGISVSTTGPARIDRLDTKETLATHDVKQSYEFEKSGTKVSLLGKKPRLADCYSIVPTDDSTRMVVNGSKYRGTINVSIWNGSIVCVNVLPMEQYLWGVVPSESPQSWAQDALKAQAVAARTYALRGLEQYPNRPFDVYNTVVDQVYKGFSGEADSTTKACKSTCGQVCMFDGSPIIAYYSAVAGGWTASGEEMFGRDLPYLKAVPSRDASVYRWTYEISACDLASRLNDKGYCVGDIQRVWVHRFSEEGRAEEVKIIHSDGVLLISGPDLRKALGAAHIKSTYFTVEGQKAPDIPDAIRPTDPVETETQSPVTVEPSVHPTTLVPLTRTCDVSYCRIITSDGISVPKILEVIGADAASHIRQGLLWIAVPGRAGGSVKAKEVSIFSLDPTDEATPEKPGSTLIEDPGEEVGLPCDNGSFVFVGKGMGHGVGMSQHGARILAESGWTYQQILKYFYTGIEIQTLW